MRSPGSLAVDHCVPHLLQSAFNSREGNIFFFPPTRASEDIFCHFLLFPGDSYLEQDFLTFTIQPLLLLICSTTLSILQNSSHNPPFWSDFRGPLKKDTVGMSSQTEELQGLAYMFFSPYSSLFPLPFPLFPLVCVPLVENCWQRTSLGLLHHVGVLLASVSSETSDLHADLRTSALWGNVRVGCGYGEKVGGNGWGRSEWRGNGMGSLKAGMLSRGRCLLGRRNLLKCLAVPSSSCCPPTRECLGMRPSCMLADDHHISGIQVWVDVHVWSSGLSWDRAKK